MASNKQLATVLRAFALMVLAALLAACDSGGLPVPAATPSAGMTPSLPVATVAPTTSGQATASIVVTALPTREVAPTQAIAASPTVATGETATPTATLMPLAERNELFEQVWQTVKDHYLYTDFRGVDWDKTREEYAKRVAGVGSAAEFYEAMGEMVGLLKDQHSRYISPEEAHEEDDLNSGEANYVGIGILSKYESKSVLIVLAFPGSPAEQAGLKRRDRILAVDGKEISEGEVSAIRGPEGTAVRLTVQSPEEEPREVTITRRAVRGKITASNSRLEVDDSIGYLLIPSLWADDMATQVEEQLGELLQGPALKGLIIDLRANEGGWRPVLTGILGQFVAGDVGSFYSQENAYPLEIGKGSLYDKLKGVPVAVLVDANSQSYSEVLAAALQASGRAKVVGTKTAGNTETIYSYNFKDGSRLWVAQEGFKLPDGTNLEGRGVLPDAIIDVDWTRYLLKNDPHVLKAVELLKK